MEVEPVQERVIEKVKLFDDEVQYEQNTMNITIRIGKAKIELPTEISQEQLVTLLKVVSEI